MFGDNSENDIANSGGRRFVFSEASKAILKVTHLADCFKELNEMRQQGLLCDVTLIADNIEIPVHKVVLASCSPYFRAMLCGFHFEESRQNKVNIEGVDARSLQTLVDFIYTSRLQVTEDNVQSLLAAANQLRLIAVLETCCKYMENNLHPENCLGIRDFAKMHGCVNLMKIADAYIGERYTEVAKSEEFMNSNVKRISDLVQSDELAVEEEEDVYESVISWIQFDRSERAKYIFDLMQFVRLPLVSTEYFKSRVEIEPLLNENSRCKDLLFEAIKYQISGCNTKHKFESPRTVPRKSRNILLVVGGYGLKSVEYFDFREERWYEATEMPSAVYGHGIAVLGDKVYVVGGDDSLNVHEYDTKADSWSAGIGMREWRRSLGVAALNGFIYAVGGIRSHRALFYSNFPFIALNSAESYDPNTRMCAPIASMLEERCFHDVGVLNNQIYAVGGFKLNSAECYNPETNLWARIANMNSKRSGVCVGVLNGFLYAIGGLDGGYNGRLLKSCEKYNPENDTWTAIADMNIPRQFAGAVAYNGMLYVIGGRNEKSLTSIEVYSPKRNKWRLLSATMKKARFSHAVCLFERFQDHKGTKIGSEEKQNM